MKSKKLSDDLVCLHIGKSGLTEGVYKEIIMLLEKRGMIKVKILKSATDDRKAFAKDLAMKTESVLERMIGSVCLLRKISLKASKNKKV